MADVDRRAFLATAAGVALAGSATIQGSQMHGLIGKMTAAPGERDALIRILLEAVSAMPGCLSYVVAEDATDPDAIWITEVWDSRESHAASLTLPEVRAAIARARPIIAGFGDHVVTRPVGGHGLRTTRDA